MTKLTNDEHLARDLYYEEIAGRKDVREPWGDLPPIVQDHYLEKVRKRRGIGDRCRAKGFAVYGRRES